MKTYSERLNDLNEEQRLAVETIDGPVLVVAGPGSGKTELLSLRVANILLQTDVSPNNILCLTFTDAAATNMRQRLAGLIGQEAYRVAIHTFHNFGTQVISRYAEHFYGGAVFTPADDVSRIELLEGIFTNLPYNDPLRSEHPEQGFVYLRPVQAAIENLKKAGLTPEEFAAIIECNSRALHYAADLFHPVFDLTVSLKQAAVLRELLLKLDAYADDGFPVPHFEPLLKEVGRSLEEALRTAESLGKATPLSQWKRERLEKDPEGRRVLREAGRLEKMRSLASIYASYQAEMYRRGSIDYADMLLSTIQVLEHNEGLRSELQEQYQYLMVDEFQDTNDAQMRLLRLLADAPVNEGRPNLMAVGDDDQAIYKFQGAEVKNITGFSRGIREPEIITLVRNYRSTQQILDIARRIITQGVDRLENILPEVRKTLIASNPDLGQGGVVSRSLPTVLHEYQWVAQEIARLLGEGRKPQDIAVIARKHGGLERLVPYLNQAGVPVLYERQQDVLRQPHIHQIIQIARFVCSLGRQGREEADSLLPELLSYPFWGLSRLAVWRLSTTAYQQRSLWIEAMLSSPDPSLTRLAEFFLDLSQRAQHQPLEYLLEAIIGAHSPLGAADESDEGDVGRAGHPPVYLSPFKEYYFSRQRFSEHRAEYLVFLSSLKIFVGALRDYKSGRPAGLADLVDFVDVHEKNGIQLTDTSPFVNAGQAVQLMTAHRAKGLEFDTVFVLSCQDDVWAGSGGSAKLAFPLNLPIAPAGDSDDDRLRLFYVALTRAKRYLYLTSYRLEEGGKEALRLQFLADLEELAPREAEGEPLPDAAHLLAAAWEGFHMPPLVQDEQALLLPLLEDYKMSVTHLNTFLDVTRGPRAFLEENLLRFPHPKSLSSSYGSAVHEAIHRLYIELKRDGVLPPPERLLGLFERELVGQRLEQADYVQVRGKGREALAAFYDAAVFDPRHESEMNFSHQEVRLGSACLTGKIDKIVRLDSSRMSVHDFKTGKAAESWRGHTVWEKMKLYAYRRQLLFYKLLIEHSRDFGGTYRVEEGVLEFVEPKDGQIVQLRADLDDGEAVRLGRLAEIVFAKIQVLDFPAVSHYSQDLAGSQQFEEDLLSGAI